MARFDTLPPPVRRVLNLVPLDVAFAEKAVKRYGADEAGRRMLDPDAIYCLGTGEIMVGEEARQYAEKRVMPILAGDGEDDIDAEKLLEAPNKHRPRQHRNRHLL